MYKNEREKVDTKLYSAIHHWLRNKFGVADRCENKKCSKKSTNYSWAKKIGFEYEFKRKNFKRLCYSCHAKMDSSPKTKEQMRNINPNTWKTHCKRGHKFTKENTYIFKNSRNCRKCRAQIQWLAVQRKKGLLATSSSPFLN